MKETIRIGCSGWSYKEWKGLFYPEEMPSSKYLSYYSQYFNTVEVNNTFYRLPSVKTLQTWHQNTPENFKYSLKVSRYITHIKRLKQTSEELKTFYGYSDFLKDKMGAFLFQFPKSFIFNDERLERLLSALDPAYENVIEFRHPSWWTSKVYEGLAAVNSTFCTVSGLTVPDDLMVLHGRAYIRFHGDPRYASPYSEEDLHLWKQKIQGASVKTLWAYFNNTDRGYAPQNALLLSKIVNLQR